MGKCYGYVLVAGAASSIPTALHASKSQLVPESLRVFCSRFSLRTDTQPKSMLK